MVIAMKRSTQLIGLLLPTLCLITSPAFATHNSHLSSSRALERAQVRHVAQIIDHNHPTWVDAASKQSYVEITTIKEQVEGLAPSEPAWTSPLQH
jgi:hypothetical protein